MYVSAPSLYHWLWCTTAFGTTEFWLLYSLNRLKYHKVDRHLAIRLALCVWAFYDRNTGWYTCAFLKRKSINWIIVNSQATFTLLAETLPFVLISLHSWLLASMVPLFLFLFLWEKIPWPRNLVEKEERFVWLTIPGYSPLLWEHQGGSSLKQMIRSCPLVRAEGSELINMWTAQLTFSLLNNPECRPRGKWHPWLKGLLISIIN